jgi:uncharacterized protein YcfL
MSRTGFLLAVAASIFLLYGCSGSNQNQNEDETPVVQDLQIEPDRPTTEPDSDN